MPFNYPNVAPPAGIGTNWTTPIHGQAQWQNLAGQLGLGPSMPAGWRYGDTPWNYMQRRLPSFWGQGAYRNSNWAQQGSPFYDMARQYFQPISPGNYQTWGYLGPQTGIPSGPNNPKWPTNPDTRPGVGGITSPGSGMADPGGGYGGRTYGGRTLNPGFNPVTIPKRAPVTTIPGLTGPSVPSTTVPVIGQTPLGGIRNITNTMLPGTPNPPMPPSSPPASPPSSPPRKPPIDRPPGAGFDYGARMGVPGYTPQTSNIGRFRRGGWF